MNILNIFIGIFTAFVETIALYIYFGSILGAKAVKDKMLKIVYVLFFVCASLAVTLIKADIPLSAVMLVLTMLLSINYKSSIVLKIFSSIIISVFVILFEIVAGLVLVALSGKSVEILTTNTVYYIEGVLISKILFLIFVKAIQYKKMPSGSRISRTLFFPLLALPVTTFFIIFIMSEYAYKLEQTQSVIVVAAASMMLIVSNILVFFLFEKQLMQDEETRESTLARQQLQYETRYYKEIAEKYRLSNKTVHDTKNLLFAISISLANNDVEKAKIKIDELCNNAFNDINLIRSGNEALDALLNTKAREMLAADINFKPNIFINSKNQVDDIDLCIVIGNALDNAIEACSKISKENDRDIILRIMQVNDLISIEVINSSIDEPKLIKGKIVTKKDSALHGFGLQSIEEIVNKYNGNLNLSYADGKFTLKLYMHNEIT